MESQRIADRYLVLRAIGRGGMGVVWLCRDEVLGREVAVKQIGGLPGEPEVETARAMREARSAAALNHPNVVSVYDVVDHDGRPWLVMEYVDGPTLAEILTDEGRLPPLRVADIGSRIAGALAGLLLFERRGVTSTVRHWLVDAAVRHRGVGGALMRRYFEGQRGVRRFLLWVAFDNEDAIRKYRHYGYAPDGLIDIVLVNDMVAK